MATPVKERTLAVSIEYLPHEDELDLSKPIRVGDGLMDSFTRTEDLGYQTFFGIKRYLCGLDEEVVKYDDTLNEEEKKAKIEEIRNIVARLEKVFGAGNLDPTNEKMWSKVKLNITRKTTNLDLTDPKNELIFHCIKGGGFKEVAPSLEKAGNGIKFYLVEPVEFAENKVANTKVINKAIATLEKLDETKGSDDIFYLGKYLLPVEKSYTKRTPKALIYDELNKYLNGELIKGSKISFARLFLEAAKKTKGDLIVTALVKDAVYMNMIYATAQGELKNNETGGIYGTTVERAVAHLQNPAYEYELANVKERVEEIWNK